MHFLSGVWGVKPFLYAEHGAEGSRVYLPYILSVDTVGLGSIVSLQVPVSTWKEGASITQGPS